MATMRAVVVKEAGGDFELEQGEIPEPGFVVRSSALASMPDHMGFEDAAPLLCAGITTFNALRQSGDARFRMVLTTAG